MITKDSPEAIAAYPGDGETNYHFMLRNAFDRGRSLHLAATREALALTIARTMGGWNDDTTEPDIADSVQRAAMEDHWIRVNKTCMEMALGYADVILSPDGPIKLVSDGQAAQREADAVIAERFVDNYPEDIFLPEGTTVDAQSARVIRHMAPVIAALIRSTDPTGSTKP